ncbi:MAG TPA: TIGR03936 family radical SAM-associated protein [Candidatus Brocadiales bacterium]|nr:TIGR03936 family radical SAM-associated protein [Candidatus Brocadiales bacterium]
MHCVSTREDFISLIEKVRIRFKKQNSSRFISHHDLMKLLERAVRRAKIPIRMSEGFNPRQKISFPLALAVGIEGLDEVVEMELNEWMQPSTLLNQLRAQLPQGIEITTVELASPGESGQVDDVTYRIKLPTHHLLGGDGASLTQVVPETPSRGGCPPSFGRTDSPWRTKINELLQSKEVTVCREKEGEKRYFNIRPSIIDIVAGTDFFELRLRATAEGMARPEEVISVLGLDKEVDCRLFEITRTKVKLAHS